jgi:cob(I)alamin adenosyltransferase
MPIYTKKGDKGETGLPGKRRLPKTDQIFETLGQLDQTNACIGLAIAELDNKSQSLRKSLISVQSDLLGIGACLAAEIPSNAKIIPDLPKKIAEFEELIDKWEAQTGALQNFILPGGGRAGANLHLARTFIRKAERDFHRIKGINYPESVSQYLNRLSDFLFQAARVANHIDGQRESIWKI